MAKILTPDDDFTADVTVPEGMDSMDTAAEQVELLAQALTNRTFHLQLHSAKHDDENTFSETQYFDAGLSVDAGTLNCVDLEASGEVSSNTIVTGTVNATDVAATGNVGAGTVNATDAVTGGTVAGTTTVSTGGEFTYSAAKGRLLAISLLTGVTLSDTGLHMRFTGAGVAILDDGLGVAGAWPIRLPQGAILNSVFVLCEHATTDPVTISLMRRAPIDILDTAAAPTRVVLCSIPATSGSSYRWGVLPCLAGGTDPVVIDSNAEYFVLAEAAATDDKVHALLMIWTDPGPRND